MIDQQTHTSGTIRFTALLFGGTICVLLAVAFMELGLIARVGALLSSILVGTGGVIAVCRIAKGDSKDVNVERLAAIIVLIGLGGTTVSVHLDRLLNSQFGIGKISNDRRFPDRMPMPPRPMMPQKPPVKDRPVGKGTPPKSNLDPLSQKEMMPMETVPSGNETAEPKIPRAIADEINRLLKESDKLFKQNQRDEAAELLVKALGIVDDKLPKNLPTRGKIAATLAKIQFGSGKIDDALRVVDGQIEKLARSDDKLLEAEFHSLAGTFLGNAEKLKDALTRFERALFIYEENGGKPMDIASIKAKIAISYARLGKKREAKTAFEDARKLLEAAGPDGKEYLDKLASVAKEYGFE